MNEQPIFQAGVLGYEEHRDLSYDRNPDGSVRDITPVEGSERAFLTLVLPTGTSVRVEVSAEDFEKKVWPCLIETVYEYRPGHVFTPQGHVRLTEGQTWRLYKRTNPIFLQGPPVRLSVVRVEHGTAYFTTDDEAGLRALVGRTETDKNGATIETIPFKYTAPGTYKKGPDDWQNGTFAAHEAWDIWQSMTLA